MFLLGARSPKPTTSHILGYMAQDAIRRYLSTVAPAKMVAGVEGNPEDSKHVFVTNPQVVAVGGFGKLEVTHDAAHYYGRVECVGELAQLVASHISCVQIMSQKGVSTILNKTNRAVRLAVCFT